MIETWTYRRLVDLSSRLDYLGVVLDDAIALGSAKTTLMKDPKVGSEEGLKIRYKSYLRCWQD